MSRIYPNIDGEKKANNGECLTCKVKITPINPGVEFNVEYDYMNGNDESETYCQKHGAEYKDNLKKNAKYVMERRRKRDEKEEAERSRLFVRLKSESDAVLRKTEEMKNKYDVKELTPYQWRINGVLDVYPKSRRYHDIKGNVRGGYSDVLDFCSKFFNRPVTNS